MPKMLINNNLHIIIIFVQLRAIILKNETLIIIINTYYYDFNYNLIG